MGQHFDLVCQYGFKHGTCRCPAKDKAIKRIKCNLIAHAEAVENYVPKHRKDV